MLRLLPYSLFLALIGVCGSACASPVEAYTLTGSVDGYTVGGTLDLDSQLRIVDADIQWDDPAYGDFEFTDIVSSAAIAVFGHVVSTIDDAVGDSLVLAYPITADQDIPVCSDSFNCVIQFNSNAASMIFFATDPSQSDPQLFDSGELTPAPEPSSLVLLGTGVLGIAGAARRRFIKR